MLALGFSLKQHIYPLHICLSVTNVYYTVKNDN